MHTCILSNLFHFLSKISFRNCLAPHNFTNGTLAKVVTWTWQIEFPLSLEVYLCHWLKNYNFSKLLSFFFSILLTTVLTKVVAAWSVSMKTANCSRIIPLTNEMMLSARLKWQVIHGIKRGKCKPVKFKYWRSVTIQPFLVDSFPFGASNFTSLKTFLIHVPYVLIKFDIFRYWVLDIIQISWWVGADKCYPIAWKHRQSIIRFAVLDLLLHKLEPWKNHRVNKDHDLTFTIHYRLFSVHPSPNCRALL